MNIALLVGVLSMEFILLNLYEIHMQKSSFKNGAKSLIEPIENTSPNIFGEPYHIEGCSMLSQAMPSPIKHLSIIVDIAEEKQYILRSMKCKDCIASRMANYQPNVGANFKQVSIIINITQCNGQHALNSLQVIIANDTRLNALRATNTHGNEITKEKLFTEKIISYCSSLLGI